MLADRIVDPFGDRLRPGAGAAVRPDQRVIDLVAGAPDSPHQRKDVA